MYIREKWPRKRDRGGSERRDPAGSEEVNCNTPLTVFTEIEKRRRKG
jgi:hypothetical protein